jgi:hypothetical protein
MMVNDKVVPVSKHHTLKMYGGVEVKLHTFITLTLHGSIILKCENVKRIELA